MQRPGFNPWVRKVPWRRAWQPTLVFLPGESHEQSSLAGYSPWGHKESDMIEHLTQAGVQVFNITDVLYVCSYTVCVFFCALYIKKKLDFFHPLRTHFHPLSGQWDALGLVYIWGNGGSDLSRNWPERHQRSIDCHWQGPQG